MWDEKYSIEEYVYGTEPNDFLREKFELIPKGNVLCLADGEGRNSVFLAKQGYTVTAVDGSAVGLVKAKKLAKKNGVSVEFLHADLESFELGINAWDGIVSIFCHVPPKIRVKLHEKVVAGLKSHGVLLLEAYTPDQLKHGTGGPATSEMTMTADQLSKELVGLTFTQLQELERSVIEGNYHTGKGAVVQLIGRKI